MINKLLPVLALAVFVAVGWHYGATVTETAQVTADNELLVASDVDRKAMTVTESENVKASIGNAQARDLELKRLKLLVAGYEAEKQKDRGDGKRLGSGSGVDTNVTTHGSGSAGSRFSSRDGGTVVGKRGDYRRFDMQSYRYSTGGEAKAKAIAAA